MEKSANQDHGPHAAVPYERGQRRSRPLGVTLLTPGVLTLAVLNLLRMIDGIRLWRFFSEILTVSPLYLVITGLLWSVTGIVLAYGLWRGSLWAPGLMRWAAAAYVLYYWIDRFLFWSPAVRGSANWPFALIVSSAALLFVFLLFSRARVKDFFGELHDH